MSAALLSPRGAIPRPPTAREFELFRKLIERESGITLNTGKRALLERRLSGRIRELALPTFESYYELVQADDSGEELVRMLDLVATNETHFFREPAHFHFLAETYERWRREAEAGERPRRVRVWSAACSTGQEPYSVAMQLLAHFPRESGWSVEVLATDISTAALARAQAATWAIEKARELPPAYLKRFMLRGVDSRVGEMRATAELREVVRFERVNLVAPLPPAVTGEFDVVLCRNVLIYFTAGQRAAVVERLARHVATTGFLLVGHAESLLHARGPLAAVRPTIYTPLPR